MVNLSASTNRRRRAATKTSTTTVAHVVTFSLLLLFGPSTITEVQGQSQCGGVAPPALIRGKKFFNSVTGEYLPIKGINYYPRPNTGELARTNSIDFFTDEYKYLWEPDVARFRELGVNVVRVYAVQPGVPHDGFLCALRAAGIWLIVGLAADCENCAVTRDAAPACYPPELKARGQFIVAEFARYDNVLAFSAGNEISLNAPSTVDNAPCQKQFLRDMRAYIDGCSATVRPIPVGLAIADRDRADKVQWYNCRSDPNDTLENAEFLGMNAYLHCDGSVTDPDALLGFEALLADFSTYETSVPVMLSEYGCISSSFPPVENFDAQRNFLQVDTLFSERYRQEFVGGVVFEYSTELINSNSPFPFTTFGEGNFGVGYLIPDDCDDIDIPCVFSKFPQFDTLAAKYNAVDTRNELNMTEYEATFTERAPPSCPANFPALSSFTWPSDAVEDRECPGPVFVQCSAIPDECTNLGIPPPPPVTLAPATDAPSMSPAMGAPPPTATPLAETDAPSSSEAPTENTSAPEPTTMEPTNAAPVTAGPTKAPEMNQTASNRSDATDNNPESPTISPTGVESLKEVIPSENSDPAPAPFFNTFAPTKSAATAFQWQSGFWAWASVSSLLLTALSAAAI